VPESILYLVQNQNRAKAQEILKRIQKLNHRKSSKYDELIHFDDSDNDVVTKESTSNVGICDIFLRNVAPLLHRTRWKLTFLVWIQWLLLGITYYGALLLSTELVIIWDKGCIEKHNHNISELHHNSSTATCMPLSSDDYFYIFWASLAEFPGGIVALYFMDIIGRKKTFAVSGTLFTTSLLLILAGCSLNITILTILLFIARGSCIAYGQCLTVYTPEVYPTHIRAIGVGAAFTFVRVGGMITPYFAHVVMMYSWKLSIMMYAFFGLLQTLIAFCLPLETMGLDLSTLDQDVTATRLTKSTNENVQLEERSLLISSENEQRK
jgi:MFS family permease